MKEDCGGGCWESSFRLINDQAVGGMNAHTLIFGTLAVEEMSRVDINVKDSRLCDKTRHLEG